MRFFYALLPREKIVGALQGALGECKLGLTRMQQAQIFVPDDGAAGNRHARGSHIRRAVKRGSGGREEHAVFRIDELHGEARMTKERAVAAV